MDRIIVTTNGSADFVIEEEFINEEAAIEGKHPEKTNTNLSNIKVDKRLTKKKIND